MLGHTGAQVQGACDGALRIPLFPPVRWLAKADHHRGTSFACYAFPSFPHGLPRPRARLLPSPHLARAPTPLILARHQNTPTLLRRPPPCVCLCLHARHHPSRPSSQIRTSYPARFLNPGPPPRAASHVHPRPLRYLRVFVIQLAMLGVGAGQGGCALAHS